MAYNKLIDLNLLSNFLSKIKSLIPTKTSDLENDSEYITGMEILSYGNSTWNDFLTAYTAKKVVYCRASSNSNPASGSQTRLAFMAYVNNADNPTNVEFQYYRSVSSHTSAQQGDQVFVYKLDKTSGWSVTTREASSKIAAGTNMTSSYSNGTLTLNADTPTKGTVGLENVDNIQQYSASNPPPYPVTSVNGSTGAVTVTVPTSVSELTNDSGYITGITSSDVTTALGYTPPTQDTTYESKAAASGGTAVSLVTTGEKYNWNTRGIPSGGSSGQVLKKSSATDYAVTWSNDSGKALHISKSSFSSLPQTISNSSVTASMRVVNCVWGTPASITGNVTWTTAAGSLTLSGSISGSTTAEIDLIEF